MGKKKSPWKRIAGFGQEFADNGKETLLVLGDYFVFSGILPTGNGGIYRDFSINSAKDFEKLLNENPELVKVLSRSNLTYLSKMAVFCESDIQRAFCPDGSQSHSKIVVRYSAIRSQVIQHYFHR